MPRRILITTTGSLGDVHPYMAVGLELQARGHAVTLATSNFYRSKVENAGLGFAPMGPHYTPEDTGVVQAIMDPWRGPEYLLRRFLYPVIREVYAEIRNAVGRADVLVTHGLSFAAHIAAAETGVPWVSTVLAPSAFFSAFDPPLVNPFPGLHRALRLCSPAVNRAFHKPIRAITLKWAAPIRDFRASLGLDPGGNPLFEAQHSPQRVLALFSRVLAEPQPDWPPHTSVTGFAFYDYEEHGRAIDPALPRFLDSGPVPVVFTLGSAAVHVAGQFYKTSLDAVRRLKCRAVLLTGGNAVDEPLPPDVMALRYAPYSQILPRAAAVVHQGGIGTTAQVLRAGRPALVVPFAFDQPDNAARAERLGVAKSIPRRRYEAGRAARALDDLLADSRFSMAAAGVAEHIGREDGARAAADAIEAHANGRR